MTLQTSVSGLQGAQQGLETTSFEISNSRSIGHKASISAFGSLVVNNSTNSLSGGTQCRVVQQIDNQQGVLENSNSSLHIAMSGTGFFVTSTQLATPNIQFTRNGMCTTDNQGNIMNVNGVYLMGYNDTQIDIHGNPLASINLNDVSALKVLNVNRTSTSISSTANINLQCNLPSTDPINSMHTGISKIYDSLGAPHNLEYKYTQTSIDPRTWTMAITSPDGTIDRADTNQPYSISITFDSNGQPVSYGGSATPPALVCNWNTAVTNAAPTTINLNVGSSNNQSTLACQANNFTFNGVNDGKGFGTFRDLSIDKDGRLAATYSNGQTLFVGRVALANFAAPDQLQALSGDAYIQTSASGPYILSLPNSNGFGAIQSNALESSTVDLPQMLTQLIDYNNMYAANTKAISAYKESFDYLLRA